jgi:hypothetical protein
MDDFIMDAIRGATPFTIGASKNSSVIFSSSSIVAARSSSQTPPLMGKGGTINASARFALVGTAASVAVPSDGLYHITALVYGATAFGQPKQVVVYVNTASYVVGGAYYMWDSTHSLFIELKKGDTVGFGTPLTQAGYTMVPTYIKLNEWIVRKVAPLTGYV